MRGPEISIIFMDTLDTFRYMLFPSLIPFKLQVTEDLCE